MTAELYRQMDAVLYEAKRTGTTASGLPIEIPSKPYKIWPV